MGGRCAEVAGDGDWSGWSGWQGRDGLGPGEGGFETRTCDGRLVCLGDGHGYSAVWGVAGRWLSQSGICLTRGEGNSQADTRPMRLNTRDINSGAT